MASPRRPSLLLALTAVISACAAEVVSVPGDSSAQSDASEVGQDVPQDAAADDSVDSDSLESAPVEDSPDEHAADEKKDED